LKLGQIFFSYYRLQTLILKKMAFTEKIYSKSCYYLTNSALVFFEVTANYSFSYYQFQTLIFKKRPLTGLC